MTALFLLVFGVEIVGAEEEQKLFDTFTLYWENDAFTGTDRGYSSGLKLTWSTPYETDFQEPNLPQWSYPLINSLPFIKDKATNRAVSLSVGHNIYTPENTSRRDLIVEDRPYAGYLYFATGFHSRTMNRKTSWEFQFGVVGPLALGEEVQNITHQLLSNNKAEGWDNQLKNEVAIEAICESQWRTWQKDCGSGYNFDLIPHLGFRVGNVNVYGNAGVEVRYGWKLPDDFGSCPIRAGCATNSAFRDPFPRDNGFGIVGWHFFAALDGRAVAHDIFLDGNTFKDSHSVDRRVWVADFMAGYVLDLNQLRLTYSYVLRTKEFDAERDYNIFGSLSASWRF
ncbi:MAG: lipid A deacylase LpxR family protein [Proteobacteria bacterium]|nr:lipid A deacylase LpxR family protein [Pseudomonadota bacterium]MBU1739021.1 lipid A deacylase LpxR family protein [Pseudomonadota bacterium]